MAAILEDRKNLVTSLLRQIFRSFCFSRQTMSERKVSESVLFSFKYTQTNTSFTLWSCVYKYINCLRFFLFFMIAYVFIFMSTLDIDFITMLIIFPVFVIQVLVQYGEQRKVIVIDDTFLSTVKTAFKIDIAETLVFQEYDNEWGEYLDIEEADFASIKDKGKLRLILKENVSF